MISVDKMGRVCMINLRIIKDWKSPKIHPVLGAEA